MHPKNVHKNAPKEKKYHENSPKVSTRTQWEELLQSVSEFIFSEHYGYRFRGLRGVKRSEKL